MSCEIEQELTAYVDGELSDPDRARVGSHLPGCPDCRLALASLSRTVTAFRSPAMAKVVNEGYAPSPALRRKVLAAVGSEPLRIARLTALQPRLFLPVAGLLAAGMIGLVAAGHLRRAARDELSQPGNLELAQNLELVENFEVVGIESQEDLEVVEHLQELDPEATP